MCRSSVPSLIIQCQSQDPSATLYMTWMYNHWGFLRCLKLEFKEALIVIYIREVQLWSMFCMFHSTFWVCVQNKAVLTTLHMLSTGTNNSTKKWFIPRTLVSEQFWDNLLLHKRVFCFFCGFLKACTDQSAVDCYLLIFSRNMWSEDQDECFWVTDWRTLYLFTSWPWPLQYGDHTDAQRPGIYSSRIMSNFSGS